MLDMWHRGLQTRVQRRGRSRAVDLVTTGFLGPRVRCLGPNRCVAGKMLVSYMPLAPGAQRFGRIELFCKCCSILVQVMCLAT